MITTITGLPGSAKTLYVVAEKIRKEFADRPVYVLGIKDLKVDHFKMPPIREWTELREVEGWEESAFLDEEGNLDETGRYRHCYNFPPNSVIIIDEAQHVFRPRPTTSKIPPHVAALEEHRHEGIDFIFMTQRPNRMDPQVRQMGRHLHLRRIWGLKRSIIYEWDEFSDNLRYSTANKSVWKHDQTAYGLYKSAEVHTARGQRPPYLFWLVAAMPLLVGGMGYLVYQRVKAHSAPKEEATVIGQAAPGAIKTVAPTVQAQAAPGADLPPALRFSPKYQDEPQSAPAYEGMVKIAQVPRVIGCIASRKKCVCYTQQGNPVPVSPRYCSDAAAGLVFDPYAPPEEGKGFTTGDKPAPNEVPSKPPENPGRQFPTKQVELDQPVSPFSQVERYAQAQ